MKRPPKNTPVILPATFVLERPIEYRDCVLEAGVEYTVDHYAPWGPVTGDVRNDLDHMVGANWGAIATINGCTTWEELIAARDELRHDEDKLREWIDAYGRLATHSVGFD